MYYSFKYPEEGLTELIKHILLGNFWSFLLVLSGVVDIAIGLVCLSGAIEVKGSPVTICAICFGMGAVYLALGVLIAVLRMRRQKGP